MQLLVSGHPLHTRAEHFTLSLRADGKLLVAASHLDLRKHGFVPVGADLQESGVVHDMRIEAVVDPRRRVIESARAAMPAVAFEPSELTRGETCRDVAGRIADLAGAVLDAGFVQRLRSGFAGPLGCSHLLTLAQMLAPTVAHALDTAQRGDLDWQRGEPRRLFCRSLSVDGHLAEHGEVQLAAQLVDLYFVEAPAIANPMQRFARQDDVRALARFASGAFTLAQLRVGERTRHPETLAEAVWRERPDVAAALRDTPLVGGLMRDAAHLYGESDPPLCDLLHSLPGAYLQVMGAMSDTWPQRVRGADTLVGIGGLENSCYMWRREGALQAARREGDPQPHA